MKKFGILAVLAVALYFGWQRSRPKRPVFKRIANMVLEEVTASGVKLRADGVVYNPNVFPIKVTGMDLNVLVNGMDAGKAIFAAEETEGKANAEFSVPVATKFNPGEMLKSGGLGGLLGFMTGQKVPIRYRGTIEVEVLFMSFDVAVDEETNVNLGN